MTCDAAWRLLGPSGFLDELVGDLAEGTSLILGLPSGPPPDLRINLAERLREAGSPRWIHQVDLRLYPEAARSPAVVLMREFGGGTGRPQQCGIKALLDRHGLEPEVYWIDGLDGLAEDRTWRDFIRRFIHLNRTRLPRARPCLVLPVAGRSDRYAELDDIGLRRRDWEGTVSVLDIALFAAQQLPRATGRGAPAARELIVQLIAELASGDFALAAALLKLRLDELLNPLPVLANLAREVCGLNAAAAHARIGDGTACLAASALLGDGRPVERALWRAQMRVLFPLLEERRTALVEARPTWLTVPFAPKNGVCIHDPFDLEIGHLLHQLRRRRPDDPLVDELAVLVDIRNRLAHLRPCQPALLRRPAVRALIDLDGLAWPSRTVEGHQT